MRLWPGLLSGPVILLTQSKPSKEQTTWRSTMTTRSRRRIAGRTRIEVCWLLSRPILLPVLPVPPLYVLSCKSIKFQNSWQCFSALEWESWTKSWRSGHRCLLDKKSKLGDKSFKCAEDFIFEMLFTLFSICSTSKESILFIEYIWKCEIWFSFCFCAKKWLKRNDYEGASVDAN